MAVLQGGIDNTPDSGDSGSIQDRIDAHINDPLLPQYNICLTGLSGSFKIPENVRLVLRECTGAVCTSAGGSNELSFVNCTSPQVDQFSGVLRFESCGTIGTVTATDSTITASSATIENLDIKNSTVEMFDCTVQTATFDKSDVSSLQNQYQSFTATGGKLYSDQDEFQGTFSLDTGVNGNLIKPQFTGSADIKASNVTIQEGQAQGDLDIEDSQALVNQGTYMDVTLKTSSVVWLAENVQDLQSTDGDLIINDSELTGGLTLDGTNCCSQNLTSQSVTATDAKLIFMNGTLGDIELTGSVSKFVSCTCETFTMSDGALASTNGTYTSFEITGGSVDSDTDKADSMVFDSLVGPSLIKTPDSESVVVTGDGKVSLTLMGVNAQTLTLQDAGFVQMQDCSPTSFVGSGISTLLMTKCSVSTGTISDVKQLLAGGSDITTLILSEVLMAVTDSVSTMTATGSNIIDNGSTITATDCTISATGSTVIATGCLVNGNGADVTGTAETVVITTGGEITNTGLTVGMGFDVALQGGSLCYEDGIGLTLEATLGSVFITATTGDIVESALVAVTQEAGAGIEQTAGAGISQTAAGTIDRNAAVIEDTSAGAITLTGTVVNLD